MNKFNTKQGLWRIEVVLSRMLLTLLTSLHAFQVYDSSMRATRMAINIVRLLCFTRQTKYHTNHWFRQGKIHGFFRLRLSQQTPVTGFFPPGWLGYPLSAKAMVPRHQQRTVASPRPKRFSWTVAPVEGMMSENL